MKSLMNTLIAQFPEAIASIPIGTTSKGQQIPGYLVALYQNATNIDNIIKRPAVLVDGLHNGREMSTVAMCVYTAMHLLSDYAQGNQDTISLLSTSAIFIIPAINYDSFAAISNQYNLNGTLNY